MQQEQEVRVAPCGRSGFGGRILVPPSKSVTQRAVVAAALAPPSLVRRPLDAEDPRLLVAALQTAGFRLAWEGDVVRSQGWHPVERGELFLGNNGTGVRFLLAQLAATPGSWRLDGTGRLRERPVAPLVAALLQLGARIAAADPSQGGAAPALPLEIVGGGVRGGEVTLDAAVSSQFVSALMLLAPRLPGGLTIRLAAPPTSRPYLELTAEVLARFGAQVAWRGPLELVVPGGGLEPAVFEVEGDWSAAAFPMAAAALTGGTVEVVGVRRDSRQGDAAIVRLLEGIGCSVTASEEGVRVAGPATRPLVASLRDTPDLFPPLAVVAAVVGGRLEGLSGLAVKESDRLAVMTELLQRLGFAVSAQGGSFRADAAPPPARAPAEPLSPADDHRVAMALAVAGSVIPHLRVAKAGCVAKSWPRFWEQWETLFPRSA